MPAKLELVETPEPTLSQEDLVRAATNDPALARLSITLEDVEYPVLDLPYDAYIRFLALLQPLLEAMASKLTSSTSGSPTGTLTIASVVSYCQDNLPELALIVLEQTDPSLTVEKVKLLVKSPFKMANIVIAQINQNKMIQEISSFFVQMLPLLNSVVPKQTQSTTKATPSS